MCYYKFITVDPADTGKVREESIKMLLELSVYSRKES